MSSGHTPKDIQSASKAAPVALQDMDAALGKALQSPGVTFPDEVGPPTAAETTPGRRKLSLSGISGAMRSALGMRTKSSDSSSGGGGGDDESKASDDADERTFTEKMSSQRKTRIKRDKESTHVSLVDILHEAECYRGVGAFGRFFVFFLFNCFVVWMHWTYFTGPFASRVQESFKGYGDVEHTADTNDLASVATMYDAFEYQMGYVKQLVSDSEERLPENLRGNDARLPRFFPGNNTAWGTEAFATSPVPMTVPELSAANAARRGAEAGANLGVYVGEHARVRFAWLRAEFDEDARATPALARRINKDGYFHSDPGAADAERVWHFMPGLPTGASKKGSTLGAALLGDNIPRAKTVKLAAQLLQDAPLLVQYADNLVLELLVTNQIDGTESLFSMGFNTVYRMPSGTLKMAVVDAQTTSLHCAQQLYTTSRDSRRAVLEVILVLLFLFYAVDEFQDVRISVMQHKFRGAHLRSGWNVLDLISNTWLVGMMVWYIVILTSDRRDLKAPSEYAAQLVSFDPHGTGPAALGGGMWRYNAGQPGAYASPAVEKDRWGAGAVALYTPAADAFMSSRKDAGARMSWLFAMVFSTFLVGLRLLKYMRFHKGLGIFTDLFRSAWVRMKDFAVIFTFFLSLLGFMLTSFFELSGGNPHFTTMASTMAQLARLTFGFMDYDDFLNQRLGMSEFDYVSAIVFWIIIVFMFVIAQNIVLAIVVDAYEDVNIKHDDMGFMDMLFLRGAFSFKRLCNRTSCITRWQPAKDELSWETASMHEMRWAVASHSGFVTVLSYFKDYATNKLYRTSRWLDEEPEDPHSPAILADQFGGRRPWNLESMTRADLVELFTVIKTSNLSRCMSVVPGMSTKPYFDLDWDVEALASLCMHWEVHPATQKSEEPNLDDHDLDISLHDINDNLSKHFSEMHDEHSSLTTMSREVQKLAAHIRTLTDVVSQLQAEKAAANGDVLGAARAAAAAAAQ